MRFKREREKKREREHAEALEKWITSSQKKKPRKSLSFSSGEVFAVSLDAKSAKIMTINVLNSIQTSLPSNFEIPFYKRICLLFTSADHTYPNRFLFS